MKKFTVEFYYYTDLRDYWEGPAASELHALVLAMSVKNTQDWIDEAGFHIKMKLADK